MSTAEPADLGVHEDIDAQLAAEFCRELKLRGEAMKSALATWGAARAAMEAARDAVEPAKKRAWTAQLRKAADADELTRRFEDARHEADVRRQELAAAKQLVREAVEAAESDVHRMRNVSLGGEAGARVERTAFVTMEHAKATRDEAVPGPSSEDAERRRRAEREAAERAAVAVAETEPSRPDGRPKEETSTPRATGAQVSKVVRRGYRPDELVIGTRSMRAALYSAGVELSRPAFERALRGGEFMGARKDPNLPRTPWTVMHAALIAGGRRQEERERERGSAPLR